MKTPIRPDSAQPLSPKTQVYYAVVLHDFVAERTDELDAKAGDPISVVAQSNREWFVAKPIGRLGRPGLIPVTFVEVRDPSSNKPIEDIDSLIDRGDLPKVEDWKRAMFSYKQNSIALGVIEDNNRESVLNSPFMPPKSSQPFNNLAPPELAIHVQAPSPLHNQRTPSPPPPRAPSPTYLPSGILLSASVVSFHFEMDEFWFRIDAMYQPYGGYPQAKLPQAKQLVLFRVYNDFYDFQVGLLKQFPREAGRSPPTPRILPYMPGPADNVDQEVTATRRGELDDYLHKLCDLNTSGAKYVLENQVIREFLAPKPGDVEHDVEARVDDIEALPGFNNNSNRTGSGDYGYNEEYESEVRDTLGQMRISEHEDGRSDGSDYDDEGYAPSPQRLAQERDNHPYSRYSDVSLRQHAHAHNHQRTGSATSFRGPSPYRPQSASRSRPNSPLERTASPARSVPKRSLETENRSSAYSRSSHWPDSSLDSPTSTRSSQVPSIAPSGRARSGSSATSNLNTPPISAVNPQTAFIKIKIFDQVTDDLIAIRVHPRVTHAELLEKVQARLGGDVVHLRYRDSMTNSYVDLDQDNELRDWLDGTDKHVLYAE